jgi:AcrR family transcriptional regulator
MAPDCLDCSRPRPRPDHIVKPASAPIPATDEARLQTLGGRASPAGAAARERIRDGAVRAVIEHGPVVSMAQIATASGVSKALLHYHYTDRAHLLADVVRRLSARLVARERAAVGAAPSGATVDALWRWIQGELQRGELRALLELGTLRDEAVSTASRLAADSRRASATSTVAALFSQLGLTPRVPAVLLGDASAAFVDGLALDGDSARDPRVSFDVFWLALLSLAE